MTATATRALSPLHDLPVRNSWPRDFALGIRLAVGGGRTAWVRVVLGAFGIGVAVAVLLVFASIGHVLGNQDARVSAGLPRAEVVAGVAPTELVRDDSVYRGRLISGQYLHGTGPGSPVPPGIGRLPGAGEIVVSPALAGLMAADPGLRARFPQRVVGTIADAGLRGPADLAFFGGTGPLPPAAEIGPRAMEVYAFGGAEPEAATDPTLVIVAVVGGAALLVPMLIFVAVSSRIAGAQRDRRLAALRLAGVGAWQVRRIAAAETLVSVAVGFVLGTAAFLGLRLLAPRVEVLGWSAFTSDVVPSPVLAVLIVVLLPVLAVGTVLVSLRRTIIEPLGVVRDGKPVRRRGWWRFVPVVAGAGLLLAAAPGGDPGTASWIAIVATGAAALLAGVPTILPWLLERTVGRLRGGAPSWQLAVRRLQLDSGTPARVVSGVAVVLAGAIAMQLVLLSTGSQYAPERAADDWVTVDTTPAAADQVAADLAGVPAVAQVGLARSISAVSAASHERVTIVVTSCATIQRTLAVPHCTDGDAFLPRTPLQTRPGDVLTLVGAHDTGPRPRPHGTFTVPAGLVPVPQRLSGGPYLGDVLLTPAAATHLTPPADVTARAWVRLAPGHAGATDRIANAVGALTWQTFVSGGTGDLLTADQKTFATISTGLNAGSIFTLLLAGVSMLVLALEQVRERRRPLALLAAAGVPRSVLARSLLWQTAVPLVLAVLAAVAAGLGLAALVDRLLGTPVKVDWTTIGVLAGTGFALVLLVTALALPALRTAMRPDSIRTE
ncbi:FtsX-like permease family protein [Amycolatopsis rhabdoformis]|uniref:FtsX-like permease family protein n=1 Tax=Amycolatopsis rhabdoformis TaxID=1448059 RepID=A0ABZ1IBW3_9PSEU|nr:FtsX-like permease family protein [Amycolatopsis rhabdoformis]WSE31069.1 FtsX-like permease family protein [Amycolatopsis rhabdoformis]